MPKPHRNRKLAFVLRVNKVLTASNWKRSMSENSNFSATTLIEAPKECNEG